MSSRNAKRSVLIVEDDSIIAWHLKSMAQRLGYEVCAVAATEEAAVQAAASHRPKAILMDVRLAQGGDGVRAAQAIRAAQDTVIIFCTAHAHDPSFAERVASMGAAVLDKPVQEAALADALGPALEPL